VNGSRSSTARTTPDGQGPAIFRKRGFESEKEAAAELRRRLVEVEKGAHVAPDKITLGEWVEVWLETERTQVRSSTWDSYARNLRLHVVPHLGSKKLQHLRPSDFSKLYTRPLQNGRADPAAGTGLSPRTVRYVYTIARKCLQAAVEVEELLPSNPCGQGQASEGELQRRPPHGLQRLGRRTSCRPFSPVRHTSGTTPPGTFWR